MNSRPGNVEKTMSLDLAEFHRGLKTIAPDVTLKDGQTEFIISAESAEVRIVYEPLENATLGGLLALPRARVTLHLDALGEAEGRAYLTRFDKAFQRGGG